MPGLTAQLFHSECPRCHKVVYGENYEDFRANVHTHAVECVRAHP
jgi:hypothetical protein